MSQPPIDPTVQQATPAASAEPKAGAQALDPLHRDDHESALLGDPGGPLHALYQQALRGLELLGDPRLKDRRELERMAVMIAMRAGANGLQKIERVVPSGDGLGYHFADNRTIDPGLRGYVAQSQSSIPADERAAVEALRARQAQERGNEQRTQDVRNNDLARDAEARRQDAIRRG